MRRLTPLLFAVVLCGLAHAQSERRDLALTVANTYAVVTANGTATCPIGGLRLSDGSLRFPFSYRGMNSEVVLPAGTNIAAIQAAILAALPAIDAQLATGANPLADPKLVIMGEFLKLARPIIGRTIRTNGAGTTAAQVATALQAAFNASPFPGFGITLNATTWGTKMLSVLGMTWPQFRQSVLDDPAAGSES